jgi:hypothetical protein
MNQSNVEKAFVAMSTFANLICGELKAMQVEIDMLKEEISSLKNEGVVAKAEDTRIPNAVVSEYYRATSPFGKHLKGTVHAIPDKGIDGDEVIIVDKCVVCISNSHNANVDYWLQFADRVACCMPMIVVVYRKSGKVKYLTYDTFSSSLTTNGSKVIREHYLALGYLQFEKMRGSITLKEELFA